MTLIPDVEAAGASHLLLLRFLGASASSISILFSDCNIKGSTMTRLMQSCDVVYGLRSYFTVSRAILTETSVSSYFLSLELTTLVRSCPYLPVFQ